MKNNACFRTLTLTLCFFLALSYPSAYAMINAPVTRIGTFASCPNQTGIVIPMLVTGFTNITSYSLRIDFDPNAATFINAIANSHFSNSPVTYNVIPISTTLSKLLIAWNDFPPVSLAATDTLIKLTFTILNSSTDLTFNNTSSFGGDCEYTDEYGDAMNDLPSNIFYYNGAINSLGVANTGPVAGSSAVCVETNGVVYSISPVLRATSYTWSLPTGFSIVTGGNTNSIIVNVSSSASSGNVSVTPSNSCGPGSPSPDLLVIVSPLPVPTISGSDSLCINSGAISYSTEPGMTNYLWTISTGGTIIGGAGTNQVQVIWNMAGLQTLSATYTGNGGCLPLSPALLNVIVNPFPQVATSVTGPTVVCGGSRGVAYQTSPIANAQTYIWTLPAGASFASGAGTPDITVDFADDASSGNIQVCGNNLCGNGPSTGIFVTVNPIPFTPVIYENGDTLRSNAADGNQWYYEGNPIAGATAQSCIAGLDGWYWCIVTLNGCSSDTSNHIYVRVTGIADLPGLQFVTYPVPNNGIFTASITSSGLQLLDLLIYNNTGQVIFEMRNIRVNGKLEQRFDLRSIPTGICTMILRTDKGLVKRNIIILK